MTMFTDLLQGDRTLSIGERQRLADERFPTIAAAQGFRLWSPGDPLPPAPTRILIGIATYSRPDLELLDQLAMLRQTLRDPDSVVIEAFNVRTLRSMQDFDSYIPGIAPVAQSPVAARWSRGRLIDRAKGAQAREALLHWLNETGAAKPLNKAI